jgi:ADP-heptose:LPS heptosyltransferase
VKCWPIERFAALAVSWCLRENGSVFTAVAADENELLHGFLKEVEEYLNATVANPQERAQVRQRIITERAPPLRRLAAVLSQVSVYAGNDAGPKHLSVAVQTPTVTVFGPEDPFEWHPYSKEMHPYFFIKDLPCRKDGMPGMPPWCGLHICEQEQHKCMRNIGVEEVLEAARKVAKRS